MPWAKGTSGNPRGRPLGTNEIGKLRASLAEHVPDILNALVAAAKRGDTSAAKLVLERVVPALKSEELPVTTLDGLSGSRVEMIAAVIEAIADGKLDMSRGGRLIVALTPEAIEEQIQKWERTVQEANDEQ
jgi:uncharacterized protein YlzI (FlbEa/FlbD family)